MTLHPLFVSGGAANRVGFVFFGDGYTESEKDVFLSDATRLARDLSTNQTFASVGPLLNFYAAFSPSIESGIGVGGVPKDTVYGLYRDGTELRAIYTSKPDVAKASCDSLGEMCDYPILLGNDPLYGGLGGPYSITTASVLNGALVLRHELGHSIISVGEEYDGGYAYYGPNSSPNLTAPFKWSHWLSTTGDTPRHERAIMPLQAYPWTMLNHTLPFRARFTSAGTYSRHLVRFSLSGLPLKDHLRVTLDDADIGWTPREDVGIDRWHYDIRRPEPLQAGEHEVAFWLGHDADEKIAQLCSVEILEYGNEDEFDATPGVISAFPTFSLDNLTTYRPTNEQCLMRLTTQSEFCKPCLEGLWLSLLTRIDLIDALRFRRIEHSSHLMAELELVPLGKLRRNQSMLEGETYEITWRKGGNVIPSASNSTSLDFSPSDGDGVYEVDVVLHTPEVRRDIEGHVYLDLNVVL
ncbi:hypothetical protein BS47DRAFT_1371740 [Hydnum rufescens UP504]|uniref:IgA peptidase M64 n=1 Tax=Hydnum rufescens UP504 TaxID=1448309 RepID=A0A9P6B345_9AGAM|nr:hypothetical protein BS47DRAFT_1371740 [Hydnum rufescens UP504]